MKNWRYNPHDNRESSKLIDFLLILGIAGGLGYLGYTYLEEPQSSKNTVVASAPEAPSSSAPSQPSAAISTTTIPSSTNELDNPPLVGRPRAPLPAQDHWTWTTTDGKVYREVKIEKIQDDYVTILHADGGARILISTLPDDIQKELDAYSN